MRSENTETTIAHKATPYLTAGLLVGGPLLGLTLGVSVEPSGGWYNFERTSQAWLWAGLIIWLMGAGLFHDWVKHD
jgi:hypothetical protein